MLQQALESDDQSYNSDSLQSSQRGTCVEVTCVCVVWYRVK